MIQSQIAHMMEVEISIEREVHMPRLPTYVRLLAQLAAELDTSCRR